MLHLSRGEGGHGAEVASLAHGRHQRRLLLHLRADAAVTRRPQTPPRSQTSRKRLFPPPSVQRKTAFIIQDGRRCSARSLGTSCFIEQIRGDANTTPACTCLRVRSVGAELQGHGVEDAHLTRHLLHAADGALLICVGELHHQAGRGALCTQRKPTRRCTLAHVDRLGGHVQSGGSGVNKRQRALTGIVWLPWSALMAACASA